MTTRLTKEEADALWNTPHAAMVVHVREKVDLERAKEIQSAIIGAIEIAKDSDDDLPIWLHLSDIDGANLHVSQMYRTPDDKHFLGELIKTIPEASSFNRVRNFRYQEVSGEERVQRTSRVSKDKAKISQPIVKRGPDMYRLPPSLRFAACDEGIAEAYRLGHAHKENWPNPFWDDAWHLKSANWTLSKFGELYPVLNEFDQAIGGKLREVIWAQGRKPRQHPGDHSSFWTTIRDGVFHDWASSCDRFLYQIAKSDGRGAGSADTADEYGQFDTTWDAAKLGDMACG